MPFYIQYMSFLFGICSCHNYEIGVVIFPVRDWASERLNNVAGMTHVNLWEPKPGEAGCFWTGQEGVCVNMWLYFSGAQMLPFYGTQRIIKVFSFQRSHTYSEGIKHVHKNNVRL